MDCGVKIQQCAKYTEIEKECHQISLSRGLDDERMLCPWIVSIRIIVLLTIRYDGIEFNDDNGLFVYESYFLEFRSHLVRLSDTIEHNKYKTKLATRNVNEL